MNFLLRGIPVNIGSRTVKLGEFALVTSATTRIPPSAEFPLIILSEFEHH